MRWGWAWRGEQHACAPPACSNSERLARLWGAPLTGLPGNKSKCVMTDYWVWEKMKIKTERCLVTLFCSCPHEEDHSSLNSPGDGREIFFTCLKYAQWDSPPSKPLIRQQSLPAMPVLPLTSGTAELGEKVYWWLCCFNTESIFPRELLFGLVHWALLQTQLLGAFNPKYFKCCVALP